MVNVRDDVVRGGIAPESGSRDPNLATRDWSPKLRLQ